MVGELFSWYEPNSFAFALFSDFVEVSLLPGKARKIISRAISTIV